MARIHIESDDELPNLVDLLKLSRPNSLPLSNATRSKPSLPRKDLETENQGDTDDQDKSKKRSGKQRALKRVDNNSVLLQSLQAFDGTTEKTKPTRGKPQILEELEIKTRENELYNARKPLAAEAAKDDSEGDTLDDIEFWSKPRAPRQDRPPPETPRAARQKERALRVPPPLTGSSNFFQPSKSNPSTTTSRPTSSSDNDRGALLT